MGCIVSRVPRDAIVGGKVDVPEAKAPRPSSTNERDFMIVILIDALCCPGS